MKLPIKKKYFEQIKSGKKKFELRDAHITFICEETGESLTKEILDCGVILIDECGEAQLMDDTKERNYLMIIT